MTHSKLITRAVSFFFLFYLFIFFIGCSTSELNHSSSSKVTGQAVLGPLVNAVVNVYRYDDLKTPIYSTTTSDSTTLSEAGLFEIPESILNNDSLYVITVYGGQDIDFNDDGIVDVSSTSNEGWLHGIFTTAQLRTDDFRVTIVTEVSYQLLRYKLGAKYQIDHLVYELDRLASLLLLDDIDKDGDIDRDDLAAWHPRQHNNMLRHSSDVYSILKDKIYSGNDPGAEAQQFRDTIISHADTPGIAVDIAIDNGYAYVADHFEGLQIVSLANLFSPEIIGTFITQDRATDVYINNGIAYVTAAASGLEIIDINNPTNPILISTLDTPGSANCITIRDGIAYIADHSNSGLQIIDINNPENPVIIGSLTTPDQAMGIDVLGDYAYIADGLSGLQVINISDPSNPVVVGSVDTPYFAQKVIVKNTTAFVADNFQGGLQIVDISDPTNPFIISEITKIFASDIKIVGDTVYIASEVGGVLVVDVTDPTQPLLLDRMHTSDANSLDIHNGYAYVADGSTGITILDINNSSFPVFTSSISISNFPSSILVNNNLAFITDDFPSQIEILDIGDQTNPSLLSTLPIPGSAKQVSVKNGVAGVAAFGKGIQLIDISDPSNPNIMGSIDTLGTAVDIELIENFAYIADLYSGLQIFDINNLANPIISTPENESSRLNLYSSLTVKNQYAYLGKESTQGLYWSTIKVFDVSDPNNPLTERWEQKTPCSGFKLVGNIAYAFDFFNRLKVIDLNNPFLPIVIDTEETLSAPREIAVDGDFMYIADSYAGVKIYDISNPFQPLNIGSIKTLGAASHVAVLDEYVYITDDPFGLRIVRAMKY